MSSIMAACCRASLSVFLLVVFLQVLIHGQGFLAPQKAHVFLRSKRANMYLLEEILQGNLERECVEERCSHEEAREVFEDAEKTHEFWIVYHGGNQCDPDPCLHGGNCTDKVGGFQCLCPAPYYGAICELEVLERAPDSSSRGFTADAASCPVAGPAACDQLCTASHSSFSCSCMAGFQLQKDGRSCRPEVDFPCGRLPVQSNATEPVCRHGNCPWQVYLLNRKGVELCSGVVLGRRSILTAARCLVQDSAAELRPYNFIVLAGNSVKKMVFTVQAVHVHEGFRPDRHGNDLAFLQLTSPLPFSSALTHLCLPTKDYSENILMHSGRNGVAKRRGGGKTLNLVYVTLDECRGENVSHPLTNKMFCMRDPARPGPDHRSPRGPSRDQRGAGTQTGPDQDHKSPHGSSGNQRGSSGDQRGGGTQDHKSPHGSSGNQREGGTQTGPDQDHKSPHGSSGDQRGEGTQDHKSPHGSSGNQGAGWTQYIPDQYQRSPHGSSGNQGAGWTQTGPDQDHKSPHGSSGNPGAGWTQYIPDQYQRSPHGSSGNQRGGGTQTGHGQDKETDGDQDQKSPHGSSGNQGAWWNQYRPDQHQRGQGGSSGNQGGWGSQYRPDQHQRSPNGSSGNQGAWWNQYRPDQHQRSPYGSSGNQGGRWNQFRGGPDQRGQGGSSGNQGRWGSQYRPDQDQRSPYGSSGNQREPQGVNTQNGTQENQNQTSTRSETLNGPETRSKIQDQQRGSGSEVGARRCAGLLPGSPVATVERGTAFLTGLVMSSACDEGDVLVFTKLSRYLNWIRPRLTASEDHVTPQVNQYPVAH